MFFYISKVPKIGMIFESMLDVETYPLRLVILLDLLTQNNDPAYPIFMKQMFSFIVIFNYLTDIQTAIGVFFIKLFFGES